MSDLRPRLALTLGDAAGIGPELVLRALSAPDLAHQFRIFVYGNATLLTRVADAARIPLPAGLIVLPFPHPADDVPGQGHVLFDFPFEAASTLTPGAPQAVCGHAAHQWITAAVEAILSGRQQALVTAPINKEAFHLAGIHVPGHTELLSRLTSSPDPCMAFYSPELMVSLATIHEPLSKVPGLLSVPSLLRTLQLTHEGCLRFGIRKPSLAVLGLNPHAGENGLFGDEESRIILPAIRQAQAEGLNVTGPLVPDTAFSGCLMKHGKAPFDAYVALYHDQGLIPFKMVAFDTGVNVTLGLPFLRTSPDHGTAFNIAWQGIASPESLFNAIRLAAH